MRLILACAVRSEIVRLPTLCLIAFTLLAGVAAGKQSFFVYSPEDFGRAIAGQWRTALGVGLAAAAYQFAVVWPAGFNPRLDVPLQYSAANMACHASFILAGWAWTMVALAVGQRYLGGRTRWLLTWAGRALSCTWCIQCSGWQGCCWSHRWRSRSCLVSCY